MCIFLILPIFKRLTYEISTDTIYLYFFICQIIYYIYSIKVSILNRPSKPRNYSRNSPIPLEESLLVVKKLRYNSHLSSISSVIGFILMHSRFDNNMSILYLQIIGFLFYFILPDYVERLSSDSCQNIVPLLVISYSFICFIFDQFALRVFSLVIVILNLSIRILMCIF